jgi:molybdopterin converting factor small subunit
MPTVKIPPPYQGPTQGVSLIQVSGDTVRACVEAVEALHPGFGEQVFDGAGRVHKFVKLFINGAEIDRSDVEHAVADGDEVEILAAIAGG